jgi:hypothetical protein
MTLKPLLKFEELFVWPDTCSSTINKTETIGMTLFIDELIERIFGFDKNIHFFVPFP